MKKTDKKTRELHEMIVKGLVLAVTAPTDEQSKEVEKMVAELCQGVDKFTRHKLRKIAEERLIKEGHIYATPSSLPKQRY